MAEIVGFSAGNEFVQIMLSGGECVRFKIGDTWPSCTHTRVEELKALDGRSVMILRKADDDDHCKEDVTTHDVRRQIRIEHNIELTDEEIGYFGRTRLGVWPVFIWSDPSRRVATVKVWIVQDNAALEKDDRQEHLNNIDQAVKALRKEA